jgi:hypothetical protein
MNKKSAFSVVQKSLRKTVSLIKNSSINVIDAVVNLELGQD